MTREEALELIERLPYIRTILVANDRYRLEVYEKAVASDDPIEWIKVVKTNYVRLHDEEARRYPSGRERNLAAKAEEQFYRLLSEALGVETDQMEEFIGQYLANVWE